MKPYPTHVNESNLQRQMSTCSALPTIKQTTAQQKTVQFALDIERPGSPTSVNQHPSFLLGEATATLLFGDYEQESIQQVAHKAINPDTGLPAECKTLRLSKSSAAPRWTEEQCNECGCSAQGHKDVQGTNTMHFIPVTKLPPGRKPTQCRPGCADRPNKENPIQVCGTVGGKLINCPHDIITKTAGPITAKITFNSTISTPGARFLVLDIKDFHLNNDTERHKHMQIPLDLIPQAIIDQCNLLSTAHNGHVLIKIHKGMHGLPQAGCIANDALVLHLAQHGHHQSKLIPGLFHHEQRKVSFCLVVGIKHVSKENAKHLINALKRNLNAPSQSTGMQRNSAAST